MCVYMQLHVDNQDIDDSHVLVDGMGVVDRCVLGPPLSAAAQKRQSEKTCKDDAAVKNAMALLGKSKSMKATVNVR